MKPFFQDGDRVVCYKGDCLEVMPELEGPIDMILNDPPYGITACKEWDQVIPFEPMWECYKRLIKSNGAVVLFGSQPFTSALVMSNPKWFRYEWIWDKGCGSNFASLKYQPFREHENILVFSESTHNFYPVKVQRSRLSLLKDPPGRSRTKRVNQISGQKTRHSGIKFQEISISSDGLKHPGSVLEFNCRVSPNERGFHPTQKPVSLLSFLIKSYTQPNDLILDNTAGSFSTGVAAILNGRRFIGIEQEDKYCKIGQQRLEKALQEVDSMLIKPWEIEAQPQPEHEQGDLFAVG